jgi:hypothetical protein
MVSASRLVASSWMEESVIIIAAREREREGGEREGDAS